MEHLLLDKKKMKEITERVFLLLKTMEISITKFCEINPSFSRQGLSNIKTGRNKINVELILSVSKTFPNTNLEWLLTGNGSMLKEGSQVDEVTIAPTSYMQVPMVPIFAQAGFLTGYGDQVYMDELPSEYWEVDRQHKGNYVCFEVKGDSMDDESARSILEGDKILGREVQRHHWVNKLHINKWNYIIVHKEEGIVVKKIVDHNVEKGIIKCHSLNPFYDDFELNLNDVIALFNVVDLKRKPLV